MITWKKVHGSRPQFLLPNEDAIEFENISVDVISNTSTSTSDLEYDFTKSVLAGLNSLPKSPQVEEIHDDELFASALHAEVNEEIRGDDVTHSEADDQQQETT